MAPDDDRAAPDDHVDHDAGEQRPPGGGEGVAALEHVQHEDEYEGAEGRPRARTADAGLGARVLGDRDDDGRRLVLLVLLVLVVGHQRFLDARSAWTSRSRM